MKIILKTDYNTRHPLIFSKMVQHPRKRPHPGTIVEVWSRSGGFVGRGFYHPRRTMAIRLLTKDRRELIDQDFIARRLGAAKDLRESILGIPQKSDSYRLIHGEADGFSGLVIDKFSHLLVMEPFSAGYIPLLPHFARALETLYPGSRLVFRPDPKTAKNEEADFSKAARLYPPPDWVDIEENGLSMRVDLASGHKTGYFLDQRDNRLSAAELSQDREVWDLFSYTGSFGIAAARGGARKVVSVDLDEKALAVAEGNAGRNGVTVEYRHRDCFDFLRAKIQQGEQSDMIIVDPAKLAGVREEIPRALKTYNDINRLAMEALKPGGLLLSCSCSGLVSEQQFLGVLFNAAGEARRELQVFRITGAAPDHPFRSDFPEGRYLKVVFARCL